MSDTDAVTIDWELDVTDSLLLQALAYVGPSVFGGIALLAGGLLLGLVVSALLDGNLARAVGVVAVAVLALVSRRFLPVVLETNLTDDLWNRYSRRGLIIESVCAAVALLGSARLHPMAPFVVFIASWVPVVLTAAFPTTGTADSASDTLVVDDTEVPLDAVSACRACSVDTFAVCWLSYTRGVPTAPRIVILPSSALDAVSNLIATEPDSSQREHSTINRTERLVAALFGLGLVAFGPLLWLTLPPGDGQIVALYAGAMFGLFGLLLLWHAYSG